MLPTAAGWALGKASSRRGKGRRYTHHHTQARVMGQCQVLAYKLYEFQILKDCELTILGKVNLLLQFRRQYYVFQFCTRRQFFTTKTTNFLRIWHSCAAFLLRKWQISREPVFRGILYLAASADSRMFRVQKCRTQCISNCTGISPYPQDCSPWFHNSTIPVFGNLTANFSVSVPFFLSL